MGLCHYAQRDEQLVQGGIAVEGRAGQCWPKASEAQ